MYSFISFFAFSLVIFLGALFFFCNHGMSFNWSGQGGSDWPLQEGFLHEPRACAISQKGVADHPVAWRIQHLLCSTITFMSFPCVGRVCVCAHVCASGRLPSCQSSRTSLLLLRLSGGCAYRLLRRSVGLTREGFPTLPWHPCAVTPLLRGGWQEGRMQSVIGAYRSLPGPEESERE